VTDAKDRIERFSYRKSHTSGQVGLHRATFAACPPRVLPVVGVNRDELADADAGIGHECENCVVAFLEVVGTTAIHGSPEGVE
jgi:hypothetical protein